MSFQFECPPFGWKMQDEQFNFTFKLMKVGGCNMILGMDWIDMVEPIVLHTRPHSMSFMIAERMVHYIELLY